MHFQPGNGKRLTRTGFNRGETWQLSQRWLKNKPQDWNNVGMRRKSGFGFVLSLNQKCWGWEGFIFLGKRVSLEAEEPFGFV